MNSNPNTPNQNRALLRYEVVCFIRSLRQAGQPLAECLRQAAARPWGGTDAAAGQFHSLRTIENWWYAAAKGGYEALRGQARRSDADHSRAMDDTVAAWLMEQVRLHADMQLTVLLAQLRKHAEMGRRLPSDSSIRRLLKAHCMDRKALRAGIADHGPTKAFEAPSPNDLWMTDYANGPTLLVEGGTHADGSAKSRSQATYLCVFIDDHSRLIPHAAYYAAANTAGVLNSLREAVVRRGLPLRLYTDQGSPFINNHVRHVCASLGIHLLHARPYHAWSKGKVERLIQTIQQDFESSLRFLAKKPTTIEELNTELAKWIEGKYHLRPHHSTRQTPHERFNAMLAPHSQTSGLPRHVMHPAQRKLDLQGHALDRVFYTTLRRVVKKNGIVSINSRLFEVDYGLRSQEVELRYDPQLVLQLPPHGQPADGPAAAWKWDEASVAKLRSEITVEVWHRGRQCGYAHPVDLHYNSAHHRGGSRHHERRTKNPHDATSQPQPQNNTPQEQDDEFQAPY